MAATITTSTKSKTSNSSSFTEMAVQTALSVGSPRSSISADVNNSNIKSSSLNTETTRTFSRTPSSWDPQDDILLRHLKEEQKLGWKEIASHFSHRTPNACQFRWRRLKTGALKNSGNDSTITIKKNLKPISALTSSLKEIKKESSTRSKSSFINSNDQISPPIYTQWSFTSSPTGNNSANSTNAYNSPNNDLLSNSISSLNSMDSNVSSISSVTNNNNNNHNHFLNQHFSKMTPPPANEPWEIEEDALLTSKKGKELSLIELNILMPHRTEEEIELRIRYLNNNAILSAKTILANQTPSTYLDSHNDVFYSSKDLRNNSISHQSLSRTLSAGSDSSIASEFLNRRLSILEPSSYTKERGHNSTPSQAANNLSLLNFSNEKH